MFILSYPSVSYALQLYVVGNAGGFPTDWILRRALLTLDKGSIELSEIGDQACRKQFGILLTHHVVAAALELCARQWKYSRRVTYPVPEGRRALRCGCGHAHPCSSEILIIWGGGGEICTNPLGDYTSQICSHPLISAFNLLYSLSTSSMNGLIFPFFS